MPLKGDLHGTQFSHATCSRHDFNPNSVVFLYDRHARVYWLPPVGLSGFFQVYSPVRNENVITETADWIRFNTRVILRNRKAKSLRTYNKSLIVLENPYHNHRQSLIRFLKEMKPPWVSLWMNRRIQVDLCQNEPLCVLFSMEMCVNEHVQVIFM